MKNFIIHIIIFLFICIEVNSQTIRFYPYDLRISMAVSQSAVNDWKQGEVVYFDLNSAYTIPTIRPLRNYSLMFGCGYTYMFSRNFGLGIEAKTYIFTRLNKEIGSLQMKLKWNLIEW